TVGKTLLQVTAFIVIMLFVGKRLIPWCIWQVSRTGSRELFTLSVIALAVSIAYGASILFGVSFALGAFFAGMVLRESEFSHRAAEKSLPLRDAFAVLFFVAVGMLFQPQILVSKPLHVLCVVAIIIVGKSIAAALLVLALRYPLHTALTVAASLAQIGEFSFILASLGMSLHLLPQEGYSLILAGAIISITLNPFIFNTLSPVSRWILKHSAYARHLDQRKDPYSKLPENEPPALAKQHVILVGYGRVGKRISEVLQKQHLPYMIVEQNRTVVESLRHAGIQAISGDATDPDILGNAHVDHASMLIIATPDAINVRKIAEVSRTLNPMIELVLRTHSEDEATLLQSENIGTVFFGEEELAKGMSHHVLKRFIPA
ncbi:MAG: sodium:proton antiporter, partial [Epsilonproteobacteria bacterium]|nr:sodium:proton antiporter [Campylobacterota bacterium]